MLILMCICGGILLFSLILGGTIGSDILYEIRHKNYKKINKKNNN